MTNLLFKIGLSVIIIGLILVVGCDADQKNKHMKSDPASTRGIDMPFIELGFIPVKKDNWDTLVRAIQNNILHSRKEPDNIAFNLYKPENVEDLAIWFEHYKTDSGHDRHKEQPYFKTAVATIKASLNGDLNSITLKEIAEFPFVAQSRSADPSSSINVFVVFEVKPRKRDAFLHAMSQFMPHVRSAPGNLCFNVFQHAGDSSKFVLMENWENAAMHDAHDKQPYSTKLHEDIDGLFVSDPMSTRWLASDISQ